MSDADHVRSTTGLSPHRKQQRVRQSSCVSARGLVPVFSQQMRSVYGARLQERKADINSTLLQCKQRELLSSDW